MANPNTSTVSTTSSNFGVKGWGILTLTFFSILLMSNIVYDSLNVTIILFFVGPTGVGKTELSKALAKFLFGDEQACIRFDMSEYAQENSDQKLIGAPPGYVGYEEGGQLTNAVREKPFSIILFDEIEKAAKPNPRILDIFLQILEDGRLTDSKGETVYFSESVIIFTSNLGASEVSSSGSNEEVAEEFIKIVKNYFDNEIKRPEILGRIGYNNIVPFNFIKDKEFSA